MLLLFIAPVTAARIWSAVRLLLGMSFATAAAAAVLASARFCSGCMVRLMSMEAVLLPAVPAESVNLIVPVMLPAVPTVASFLA